MSEITEALGRARELVANTPIGELGSNIRPRLSYEAKWERADEAVRAIEKALAMNDAKPVEPYYADANTPIAASVDIRKIAPVKPVEGDAVELVEALIEAAREFQREVDEGTGEGYRKAGVELKACQAAVLAALSPQPGNDEVIERGKGHWHRHHSKAVHNWREGGMKPEDGLDVMRDMMRTISHLTTIAKPSVKADGERT